MIATLRATTAPAHLFSGTSWQGCKGLQAVGLHTRNCVLEDICLLHASREL